MRQRSSALVGPLLHDVLRIVHYGLAQLLALAALAAISFGATARSCCRRVASTVCCFSCRKVHGPQAWSNATLYRLLQTCSTGHRAERAAQTYVHVQVHVVTQTRRLAYSHGLPVQPRGGAQSRTYRALQRACQSCHVRPLAHFRSESGVEQVVLERDKGLCIAQAQPLAELLLLPLQELPRLANIHLPLQVGAQPGTRAKSPAGRGSAWYP